MDKATKFFHAHAGYSYGPGETKEAGRARCARALAEAERKASDLGYSFEWGIDQFGDSSNWDDTQEPYAVWSCVARNGDGEVVASLGGIDFGRDGEPWGEPYRRVVEAELALEALSEESGK